MASEDGLDGEKVLFTLILVLWSVLLAYMIAMIYLNESYVLTGFTWHDEAYMVPSYITVIPVIIVLLLSLSFLLSPAKKGVPGFFIIVYAVGALQMVFLIFNPAQLTQNTLDTTLPPVVLTVIVLQIIMMLSYNAAYKKKSKLLDDVFDAFGSTYYGDENACESLRKKYKRFMIVGVLYNTEKFSSHLEHVGYSETGYIRYVRQVFTSKGMKRTEVVFKNFNEAFSAARCASDSNNYVYVYCETDGGRRVIVASYGTKV
jgi:hypothetical protein